MTNSIQPSLEDFVYIAANELIDSADQEGCTPDLVVVSADLLQQLAEYVENDWKATIYL